MNQTLLKIVSDNKGLILSAVGAFMRGESPQSWIKKLATTHPALKELNLDDLDGTAAKLCKDNNINQTELTGEITEFANSYIHK